MPAAVDLVIFDCDGVLIDSERIAVRVERGLLADLGWDLTEDEIIRRFVGKSNASMIGEIEAHLGHPVPDFLATYLERTFAAFRADLEPVPGIVAALHELEIATCVASSGTHDKMRLTLGLTGLYERFEGRIFSASEVEHGKPAPDLFLHAAATMGVAPANCVVVEDSPFGTEAARAAGMRALGFAGGLTAAEHLEGPDTVVFDDMADLVRLITSLSV